MAVVYSQNGVIVRGGGNSIAAITNINSNHYYEIPMTMTNKMTFEIILIPPISGNGIISFRGNKDYAEIGLNSGFYLDIYDGILSQGRSFGSYSACLNKLKIYTDSSNKICTEVTNLQTGETNTDICQYASELCELSKIRIYKGRDNYNSSIGCQLFYIKVSNNGNTICELIPDEKNGIAGFTDIVSKQFFSEPYNDNSIFAIKSIT